MSPKKLLPSSDSFFAPFDFIWRQAKKMNERIKLVLQSYIWHRQHPARFLHAKIGALFRLLLWSLLLLLCQRLSVGFFCAYFNFSSPLFGVFCKQNITITRLRCVLLTSSHSHVASLLIAVCCVLSTAAQHFFCCCCLNSLLLIAAQLLTLDSCSERERRDI